MALRYKVKIRKTYKDKEGNEKSSYLDIGAILDTKDGGYVLKLESIPVGWDGWAYLSEPEQKQQRSAPPRAQNQRQSSSDDFDDDIPF